MRPDLTESTRRQERAARALATLGMHRSDHQVLSVQCSCAHHVATVYETDAGLVHRCLTGPRSHGSKDFLDTGKHGHRAGSEYADLLDAGTHADDDLPAWCDCGPHTLSRSHLLALVRSGERTLRLP